MSLDAIPLFQDLLGAPPPKKLLKPLPENGKKKRGPRKLNLRTKCSAAVAEKMLEARKEIIDTYGGLPTNYIVVATPSDLGTLSHAIATHRYFDWDTETGGLNPWVHPIYCVSFWVDGKSYLVNFSHPLLPQTDIGLFGRIIGPYFADDGIRKRGFNIKFDAHFIEQQAGIVCGYLHGDAGTALWLTHEIVMGTRNENRLKPLCSRFLGLRGASYDEAFGMQAWITIDPLVASYYACKDADLHFALNEFAEGLLEGTRLKKLYHDLEMPFMNLLYETERDGLPVEEAFLPKLDTKLTADIEALRNEMDALVLSDLGHEKLPLWTSDEQVAKLLFDVLGIPRVKQNSTDVGVLDRIKDKHPVVPMLMRFRKLTKLKSAFVDALGQFIVRGRIHPSFKGIGSTSGRGACTNPNMYQIPNRGEGAAVRQAFIADDQSDDFYLVSKDYSGQELGLQAFMSGDEALKQLIRDGRDFYSEATAVYYGGVAADFEKHGPRSRERDNGKRAVLAMSYGAQAGKVAEVFGCTYQRGQRFIDDFYAKFFELRAYQKRLVAQAKSQGYVETILGRRRHLDFANPMLERFQRLDMERQAINSPTQGSATDQIKLAGILIARHFKAKGYKSRLLFPIHDEWVAKISKDEMFHTTIMQEMDAIMRDAIKMDIPVNISTEVYSKWGKVVKFETFNDNGTA